MKQIISQVLQKISNQLIMKVRRKMGALRTIIVAIILMALTINLIGLGVSLVLNITFLRVGFYDEIILEQQFYAQIRQWLFKRVSGELPHGHEAIPYLEKVLTEHWLRQEIISLGNHVFDFFKGKTQQLPILPIYKLFENLAEHMDNGQTIVEKYKLIRYWFGPIPDRVRIQDIQSIDVFWKIRQLFGILKWIPWGLSATFIILCGLLITATRSWKQTLLWVGTSLAAAGGIIIEMGIVSNWAIINSNVVQIWIRDMTAQGFPQQAVLMLINRFIENFTVKSNVIALLSIIIGSFIIYLCPLNEKTV